MKKVSDSQFGFIPLIGLFILLAVAIIAAGTIFYMANLETTDTDSAASINASNVNVSQNVNMNGNVNAVAAVNANTNVNGNVSSGATVNSNTNSSVNSNVNTSVTSQPTLTKIGGISTGEGSDPIDIALAGSYAYLADGVNKKLRIINVANPTQPVAVGSYADLSNVQGVKIVANRLYVGDSPNGTSGLSVFNISEPTRLQKLGFYERIGTTRIYGQVEAMGDYVYLPAGPGGLEIISVNDPSTPVLVGSVDTEGRANDVAVVQQLGKTIAYVADDKVGNVPGRLYVVDVTDPNRPTVLGSLRMDGESSRVKVVGTTAYVADGSGGLIIVDVTESQNPKLLGTLKDVGSVKDVVLSGSIAYVSTPSTLMAVDVSLPELPRVLATANTTGAFGLAYSGDLIYVAAENGLVVFRYSTQ